MTSKTKLSAFSLRLPATSANLGPAFDAAALAMTLYLKIRARVAPEFSIAATGRDYEVCQKLENHLILTTYREVLEQSGKPVVPLALQIENGIPLGKGCGSSAAARLVGIALANHFGRLRWSDSRIIGEASKREHHPDNAAACWLGGLVVARLAQNGEAQYARINAKGRWPLLLAIPPEPLSTEKARQILPTQCSREDAVTNIQNSALLMQAFAQGRRDLLGAALQDRIHQPYRAQLCPLLPCLEKLVGKGGVLGVALSGAGPSVLIFQDPKVKPELTKRIVKTHIAAHGLSAELLTCSIDAAGAK